MVEEKNIDKNNEESDIKELSEEAKRFKAIWQELYLYSLGNNYYFGVGTFKDDSKTVKIRILKGEGFDNIPLQIEPGKFTKVSLEGYPRLGIKKKGSKITKKMTDIPVTQGMKFNIKRLSDFLPMIPTVLQQVANVDKFTDMPNQTTYRKKEITKDVENAKKALELYSQIESEMNKLIED
jgi:hypothetical protein